MDKDKELISCQEELFIVEYQGDFIDFELSKDFKKKIQEQIMFLKRKMNIWK